MGGGGGGIGGRSVYSTLTRTGEGANYRYISRQGKIAGISTRRSRVDYFLVDPRGL